MPDEFLPINKTVSFQFYGEELKFHLSQSLFSSYDIDKGTRLLLNTIIRQIDLTHYRKVIDVGCGAGVLAICLKKKAPDLDITCLDRDALALRFTLENARLNNIQDIKFSGSLGLSAFKQENGLIVSNLPAKAGRPVLNSMIKDMARLSSRGTGMAAIVIVLSLKDFIEKTISECCCEMLYRKETREHAVFHFKGKEINDKIHKNRKLQNKLYDNRMYPDLLPYIRNEQDFILCKEKYHLKTAFNLPDFDTVGYPTKLAGILLDRTTITGTGLIWNPGQGHIACFLISRFPGQIQRIILGGRDFLSLLITHTNLLHTGIDEKYIGMYHLALFIYLKEKINLSLDWMIFFPDESPGLQWQDKLFSLADSLLKSRARLLVVARSSSLSNPHRLIKGTGNFHILYNRKYRGNRGLLCLKERE
jgi:hypothetical protein